MAKAQFHQIIKWFRGKIGGLVFRRSHNGEISVYPKPHMSEVEWSRAQKDHRRHMKEAWQYASAAVADPDIRPLYVQMAREQGRNPRRPFDTAVSDYYNTGNDLLWKKHMGEQAKPAHWKIYHYEWYRKKQKGTRKRRAARRNSPSSS